MPIDPGMGEVIVEDAPEVWRINGRLVGGANIAVSDEVFDQFRHGYRCLRCYGVQPEAFPDECVEPFCRFPIRADQLRYLEAEHRGEQRYGPSPIDDAAEEVERQTWTPKTGIWLPKGVQ